MFAQINLLKSEQSTNQNEVLPCISLKTISNKKRQIRKNNFKKTDNTNFDKCENCGKCNLFTLNGKITCNDCGLIFSKHIDTNIEWRISCGSNNNPSDKIRTSINENKYISGNTTTTTIGQNASFKNIKNNNLIKTMSEWKQITYKDKTMIEKINNLTSICRNNDINDMMIDKICETFYKICKVLNPRRKKLIALMATSVLICFEEEGIVKDIDDISQIFDIDEKLLIKLSKEFEITWQEIKYTEQQTDDKFKYTKSNNDVKFNNKNISKKNENDILITHLNNLTCYLKKCQIPNIRQQYFKDLYTKIFKDRQLLEHIQKSKFAVVIYQSCLDNNIDIELKTIINICKTSYVTFNKCYKKFKNIYLVNND